MKTLREYVEAGRVDEGHFSDDEMKKIKKHYKDNSEVQRMLDSYKTAEKQNDMKKAKEYASGIKKIAKDDKVI